MDVKRIGMNCENCGSDHVTRDAWAEWDAASQGWILGAIFDYAFCHKCQEETHIEEVPIGNRGDK